MSDFRSLRVEPDEDGQLPALDGLRVVAATWVPQFPFTDVEYGRASKDEEDRFYANWSEGNYWMVLVTNG